MKVILLLVTLFSFQAFAEKVLIEVPGMVCQMCVQGMKKNFKSAVKNADNDVVVDLEKKTVEVNLLKKISDENIKKRVNDAGYNAKKITWLKKKKKQKGK